MTSVDSTRDDRARQFEIGVQKARALVYGLAGAIGIGGVAVGIVSLSWREVLICVTFALISAAVFGVVAARGITRFAGISLRGWWILCDAAIITLAVYLSGGSASPWYPWYLTNAGAAAYLLGRRGLIVISLTDLALYLVVVKLTEAPAGGELLELVGKMVIMFGACSYVLLGIVRLQENRIMIKNLRNADSDRASVLEKAMATIARSANGLVHAADGLTLLSQSMSSQAENTETRAGLVSASAEDVSSNLAAVAAAVEELNSSVVDISRNANEAAVVAGDGVGVAESTTATMQNLRTSSSEIRKVIETITSIAEQTRMLALNASIEAARAGEAGTGFAVVAGEVKELARATALAVEDVRNNVETIQADTDNAVVAIDRIRTTIRQINELQESIAAAVEEQSATTSSIAVSVTDAARGGREISEAMIDLAGTAAEASAGAAQTLGAAQELADLAEELRNSGSGD